MAGYLEEETAFIDIPLEFWYALFRYCVIETVRVVMATEIALIFTKGINGFPSSN